MDNVTEKVMEMFCSNCGKETEDVEGLYCGFRSGFSGRGGYWFIYKLLQHGI